jgi:hypothetical protein
MQYNQDIIIATDCAALFENQTYSPSDDMSDDDMSGPQ